MTNFDLIENCVKIYRFKNSYLFFHFTGELEDEKGSESKQDEEVNII